MSKKALSVTLLSAAILGSAAACSGHASGTAQTPIANGAAAAAVTVPSVEAAAASAPPAAASAAPAAANTAPIATSSAAPSATPTTVRSRPVAVPSAVAATGLPNPGQYVAAAWLSSAQMPLYTANVTMWQVSADTVGTRIGGEVFADPASQALVQCTDTWMGEIPGLRSGLRGEQIESFGGPNSDKIWSNGVIPAGTWQSALFYRNATDAAQAMDGLAADFASCKSQVTAVDPTTGQSLAGSTRQTLARDEAECWSVLAVPADGQHPGTLDHDCFVRSGSMIEEVNVEVNEVPSLATLDFTHTDTTVVAELEQVLQKY